MMVVWQAISPSSDQWTFKEEPADDSGIAVPGMATTKQL
jgi:hypothetical protein